MDDNRGEAAVTEKERREAGNVRQGEERGGMGCGLVAGGGLGFPVEISLRCLARDRNDNETVSANPRTPLPLPEGRPSPRRLVVGLNPDE